MINKKYIITAFFALLFAPQLFAQSDIDSVYNPTSDYPTLRHIDSMRINDYYNALSNNNFNISLNNDVKTDSRYATDDAFMAKKMKELNDKTPFNLVFNPTVKQYIDFYLKKKKYLERVMARKEEYFPLFENTLDKYNMPFEIKYLAIVESALNPVARSHARAVGLWQFIYSTGRLYNLNSTSLSDDRNNPYKETEAACQYLKNLHDIYHNWDLALAAYNCGTGNVNRAIRRSNGNTDFWKIMDYLPRETRGYVPAFIAVNYIIHYAKELGIQPNYSDPMHSISYYSLDTIHVSHDYSFDFLSKVLDMPKETIAALNPSYRFGYIPKSTADNTMILCLPSKKMGYFLANCDNIFAYQAYKDSTGQSQKKLALRNRNIVHRVRRGEYLGLIARHYHCSVRQLKIWNNLHSNRLRIGQHLHIYLDGSQAIARYKQEHHKTIIKTTKTIKSGKYAYHIVQSGDTLWDIAKMYNGVTVEDLKALNVGLDFRHLKPGTKIKVEVIG